ncbi:hypothetical protein FGO68_gene4728 [Halteria grandinella]|uniref:peptidyl-tRNA hydrolase n=1 Tax=Halteria grandinella TaxID=5974 RepID=A0A8J8NJ39_HALGN|nr:hypothetical protein FGO68_gene4728 [Halteria grandinella]
MDQFKIPDGLFTSLFPPRSDFECKMNIAVRVDNKTPLANLPIGLSARLVSEAVIHAYQSGLQFDAASVRQWELGAWPKIAVKCRNEGELREVEKKAKENGVNSFVLEKPASELGMSGEGNIAVICVVGPALKSKVDMCTGHLKLL